MHFVNNNFGVAVGSNSTILKTTDGGTNSIRINSAGWQFTGVYFFDENVGIAIGGNAYICKTTDGGKTGYKNSISGVIYNDLTDN